MPRLTSASSMTAQRSTARPSSRFSRISEPQPSTTCSTLPKSCATPLASDPSVSSRRACIVRSRASSSSATACSTRLSRLTFSNLSRSCAAASADLAAINVVAAASISRTAESRSPNTLPPPISANRPSPAASRRVVATMSTMPGRQSSAVASSIRATWARTDGLMELSDAFTITVNPVTREWANAMLPGTAAPSGSRNSPLSALLVSSTTNAATGCPTRLTRRWLPATTVPLRSLTSIARPTGNTPVNSSSTTRDACIE